MPKVSVIICHFTGTLIERALESLKNKGLEIIVITSDFSFKTKHKIILKRTKINNPSLKRNLGSETATGDYLVFMDDDVEIEKDCIKNMVKFFDLHPKAGMVYAHLFKMDDHSKVDTSGSYLTWNGFLWETYQPFLPFPLPILSGKSACCMVKKRVFFDVGRFDTDFVIYGEETDLSWRIWNLGYQVMITPKARAYHAFETSLKPKSYYISENIHYHGCKNYITMLLKNLPSRKLYIALLNASVWFTMTCLFLFKNKKASKLIFKGLWYNVVNLRYIWNKRKRYRVLGDYYPTITKNPPLSYYTNRCKEYLTHQLHG